MKPILLILTLAAVALAGCTNTDETSDANANGANPGQSGSEVTGTVEVGEDTNSSAEENTTGNETAET